MLLKSSNRYFALAVVILCLILVDGAVRAQETETECTYDSLGPSLENARGSYGAFDLYCAAREILDFVAIDTIASEQMADGYRLLSQVMYDSLVFADTVDIKQVVTDAGKLAWKADPDWDGEYEINNADYVGWMDHARQLALDELESEHLAQVEQARKDSIELAEQARTDSIALAKQQTEDSLTQPILSVSTESEGGYKTAKIVTGLACAVATSATVVAHFSAKGKYEEYRDSSNSEELPSLWNDYEKRWKLRNTAGVIALGLAALEMYWFLSSSSESENNTLHGFRIKPAGFGAFSSIEMLVVTYEF
ncbi:MAG: hypothetical protein U9N55_00370 [candidate division Zixibacteria bacterium]|nr:hypothetical protein [candidate division Zixibacteria bacterium]